MVEPLCSNALCERGQHIDMRQYVSTDPYIKCQGVEVDVSLTARVSPHAPCNVHELLSGKQQLTGAWPQAFLFTQHSHLLITAFASVQTYFVCVFPTVCVCVHIL